VAGDRKVYAKIAGKKITGIISDGQPDMRGSTERVLRTILPGSLH
jgi:hypothetical protein